MLDTDGAGEHGSGMERSCSGTCSDCGSISYSRQWETTFGVRLCNECKGNYSLISKGTAKQKYAVTDGDLKKLGTLEKPNPQYKQGAPMQLYLELQVEEISLTKHGSEDQRDSRIEQLRHARSGPGKAAKTKAEERKAAALQARIAGTRKRVSTDVPRISKVFSKDSSNTSSKGSPTAAAADVEEI